MPLRILSLVVASAAGILRAQDEPNPDPKPQPVFEATSLDNAKHSGRLQGLQLSPDGSGIVVLQGEITHSIAASDLVTISRVPSASTDPTGALILFPDGDRLYAPLDSADEGALVIGPGAVSEIPLRVPLDRVLGVVLALPSTDAELRAAVDRIRNPEREGEVVWLANGDNPKGRILGLDVNVVRGDFGSGETKLTRDSVLALAYDPALADYPRPAGMYFDVGLTNGSRIGITDCRLERGVLSGAARFGASVAIPVHNIAYIYAMGGRVSYLSQREPSGVQFVPYLDRHPGALGRDKTWDRKPIRIAGRTYERGLGMLPRTLAAYRIEPGDRRFRATVGLDQSAGPLANVVLRVLVDRTEVFASPPLTAKDPPVPIDIDLAGGRLLVLIAEFGDRGDVQDSAVWADALIITDPPTTPQ